MFFILSKTIYHLLMPTGLLFLLTLSALLVKKWRKRLLILAFVVCLVFSNRWLANEALLAWEIPPKTYEELPTYEVGVVLSGMRNPFKSPRERIHFAHSSDRLWQTIFLYRKGKIKKILLTGADFIDWQGEIDTSRYELREALLACGIPDSVILVEPLAINTAQNAEYSAKMLKKEFPAQTEVLLITSAFHMRRAAACFDKQEVKFTTFSTDFRGEDRTTIGPDFFFPDSRAMRDFEIIGKEIIGMIVYRLKGQL